MKNVEFCSGKTESTNSFSASKVINDQMNLCFISLLLYGTLVVHWMETGLI